jgi:hypothetical protein
MIAIHFEDPSAPSSMAPLSDVLTRQAMHLHHTMVLHCITASTRYT